jgi:hypothetical protein
MLSILGCFAEYSILALALSEYPGAKTSSFTSALALATDLPLTEVVLSDSLLQLNIQHVNAHNSIKK